MDLGKTNFSSENTWANRVLPSYSTQSSAVTGRDGKGVSWDYIIKLANDSNKDLWVCVPHAADDNYVTQLALLIKNNLNSSHNVYVEYSNEVWNGQFTQKDYNQNLAVNDASMLP